MGMAAATTCAVNDDNLYLNLNLVLLALHITMLCVLSPILWIWMDLMTLGGAGQVRQARGATFWSTRGSLSRRCLATLPFHAHVSMGSQSMRRSMRRRVRRALCLLVRGARTRAPYRAQPRDPGTRSPARSEGEGNRGRVQRQTWTCASGGRDAASLLSSSVPVYPRRSS